MRSSYEPQVIALCRRYLVGRHRDPAVDEHDLAMDAFVHALHHLDRYEDRSASGAAFGAWLLAISRSICLKFLAKQRRRQQLLYDGSDQAGSVEAIAKRPAPAAQLRAHLLAVEGNEDEAARAFRQAIALAPRGEGELLRTAWRAGPAEPLRRAVGEPRSPA